MNFIFGATCTDEVTGAEQYVVESDMTLLAIVGIEDPVRPSIGPDYDYLIKNGILCYILSQENRKRHG